MFLFSIVESLPQFIVSTMWQTAMLASDTYSIMLLSTITTHSQTVSLFSLPGAGAPVVGRQRTQW